MKTIAELAQESLDVQNACNLSAVVHTFSRAMTDLRANLPNAGTDEINQHPIAIMYSSKIEALTGWGNVNRAIEQVSALIQAG